jgi:hypothetical protein
MGLARYFVVPTSSGWMVTLDGRTIGRYPTRSEAADAAIVMANLMGAMQHDADVMLEREPGAPLELIWTYGVDALPTQRIRSATRPPAANNANAAFKRRVKRIQRGEAAA